MLGRTLLAKRMKLEHLAKEAAERNISCTAFGAEIVDEGGLPQLARK
jgi:hypothetical protein